MRLMTRIGLAALFLAATSFAANVPLPRPAGEVTWEVPGKGKDSLANYRGKVVLFCLILTDCPECQRATKIFSGIQTELKKFGVQVIEATWDGKLADVKKYIDANKPNFPVGLMDGDVMLKFTQVTPEMRATVPMTIFVDRTGVVQSQYFGAEPFMDPKYLDLNVRAKLLNLVQRPVPPGTAPVKK